MTSTADRAISALRTGHDTSTALVAGLPPEQVDRAVRRVGVDHR